MSSTKPRVLLTNDDGPPGPDSPYIYGLYKHLTRDLGWDVKVVVPSSQKSWIGKAYHIKDIIRGRYYYPHDPDGLGEISEQSRPVKEDELGEWILLDGTPATCANIALHNLYNGQVDLLLSGPNLGRNTSSAFALSSGTIGAALSSSLSRIRSIALSYGTVQRVPSPSLHTPAHTLAGRIIQRLWDEWGVEEGGLRAEEVDLYNVNIPMVDGLLAEDGMPVLWTRIWRNTYGRLFKEQDPEDKLAAPVSGAGPDAPETPGNEEKVVDAKVGGLVFKFAPDMSGLIGMKLSSMPEGSDGWAMEKGWASVTPLQASFAEPPAKEVFSPKGALQDRIWRMKL